MATRDAGSPSEPFAAARSAVGLTALTVLSPVAGLAVEAALAWRFGVSEVVDALRAGMILLLFAQQIFWLQVLPNLIVPAFAANRARGNSDIAWRQALRIAVIFLVPTAAASAFIFADPLPLVALLAPGFEGKTLDLACFLVRWFSLALVPTAWCGIAAGILNAHGIFWLPAAANAIANTLLLLMILAGPGGQSGGALVLGVLAGAAVNGTVFTLRLLPLFPGRSVFSRQRPTTDAEGSPLVSLALPLFASAVVAQWYGVIFIRALSDLPPGSLATFSYAWRAGQLVTILPTALATVLFPRFAVAGAGEGGAKSISTRALRMALFLALPLTAVLLVQREPLFALLFERGEFSPESRRATAALFAVLTIAIPASVVFAYVQKILYATQRVWIPLTIQAGCVAFLMVVAAGVAGRWGATGLAALVVISSWVIALGGLAVLDQTGAVSLPRLITYGLGVVPLSAGAAWSGGLFAGALAPLAPAGAISEAVAIGSSILVAGIFFVAASLLLRIPEAVQGWQYLEWQWGALFGRRRAEGLG